MLPPFSRVPSRSEFGTTDGGAPPRVYEIRLGWRLAFHAFGGLLVAGPLAGVCAAYVSGETQDWTTAVGVALACACLAFMALGVYVLVDTSRSRVLLHGDTLEVLDLRGSRRLRRDQIAGRRVRRGQGATCVFLVPRDDRDRAIELPMVIEVDAVLAAWLDALPDLDAVERDADAAAVAADPELGATPEERVARVQDARRVASALHVVGGVLGAWALFHPRPYELVMALCIATPWVGILMVAAAPALYRFDGRPGDLRPNVLLLILLPSCGLAMRALRDVNLLDPYAALGAVGAAWAAIALAAALADRSPRANAASRASMAFLLLFWAGGSVVEADALLDRSPARRFEARVVGKHVTSGKHRTWHLRLSPWGPRQEREDVMVSRAEYAAACEGDAVCVSLRPGALRIAWFRVALTSCSTPVPR